jgi:CheY-like chemotaxis protein
MRPWSTVLLAEDDENDALLLQLAFAKAKLGHNLVHVQDGQDVLNYLSNKAPFADAKLHPKPDLLILDIKMPRLNGFDVLQWLNGRADVDFPVVVLSSSQRCDDKERATQLGAAAYHVKSGEQRELVGFAVEVDRRWLKHRRSHRS